MSSSSVHGEGSVVTSFTGSSFRDFVLGRLCGNSSSKWPKSLVVPLLTTIRDLHPDDKELKMVVSPHTLAASVCVRGLCKTAGMHGISEAVFVCPTSHSALCHVAACIFQVRKVQRESIQLELQELPPLVYQLLLLSTHGQRQTILVSLFLLLCCARLSSTCKSSTCRYSVYRCSACRCSVLQMFCVQVFCLILSEALMRCVWQEMVLELFNILDNKCAEPVWS